LVAAAAASATAAAASATAADASADAAEAALAGVLAGSVADNAVSTAKVQNDAITNIKLANMATQTVKGRVSASTGDPEDLSATQLTTLINAFTTSLKGAVPPSGGGTANFLRADGTWASPVNSAPTGSIFAFAATTVPSGYLECNGASVSRTTYGSLFSVIGTTYGSADGASFNVPDLRGHFVRGWDNSRGVDPARALGSTQAFAVGPHGHTATSTGTAASAGDHTHTIPPASTGSGATAAFDSGLATGGSLTTGSGGAHTHTLSITTTVDSNGGTESRPVNTAMMYIIKT
jgi:microcystin-dependent protein